MSIEWKKADVMPPKDGNYFCRVTTQNGYLLGDGFHLISDKLHTSEYSVPFTNGEWILGSSQLFGAKVIEWLDHVSPESNPSPEPLNKE